MMGYVFKQFNCWDCGSRRDVGHWPSIEVLDRIGKAILDRLGGYGKVGVKRQVSRSTSS